MPSAGLGSRATQAIREIASDTGRLLFFFVLLSVALLANLLFAAVAYGMLFVSGGTDPLITAVTVGGRRALQILYSFTEPQSTFHILSLYSALFMGALAHWVYQKSIAGFGRLRRRM